jgi:hypothetical protein
MICAISQLIACHFFSKSVTLTWRKLLLCPAIITSLQVGMSITLALLLAQNKILFVMSNV